jgi:hypothetical protein
MSNTGRAGVQSWSAGRRASLHVGRRTLGLQLDLTGCAGKMIQTDDTLGYSKSTLGLQLDLAGCAGKLIQTDDTLG